VSQEEPRLTSYSNCVRRLEIPHRDVLLSIARTGALHSCGMRAMSFFARGGERVREAWAAFEKLGLAYRLTSDDGTEYVKLRPVTEWPEALFWKGLAIIPPELPTEARPPRQYF
jgi:hypothetical protein